MQHGEDKQHEAKQQVVCGADLFICQRLTDLGRIVQGMRSGVGKKKIRKDYQDYISK